MSIALAVAAASVAWFVLAGICFFNPPVDRFYRSQEGHPGVRALPQEPKTIATIFAAVVVQCAIWVFVYRLVEPALPGDWVSKGLAFGGIIVAMKMIPRDIDRVLLTTYPSRRLGVEAVIGILCAFPVGLAFACFLSA